MDTKTPNRKELARIVAALLKKGQKPHNKVAIMDSVDALDLLAESLRLLRLNLQANPAFLDRLREQRRRHRRALRHIIGGESI